MPRIRSIGTALPRHRCSQAAIKGACSSLFGPLMRRAGRSAIFDRAGVGARHLVEPLSYYLSPSGFESKNDNYLKHALPLSRSAIRRCLGRAKTRLPEIAHIFSVTTTGLLTPSLEAHLAQSLPFSRSVKRTPLFGVGCAGSAVGLARASEYLTGHPEEYALLLSVELCSLTFLPQERSMTQLVAAALFGDGAGAALLAGGSVPSRPGDVEILRAESLLLPDSLDAMGWRFTDEGLSLVLSTSVPRLVQDHFADAVRSFIGREGLAIEDIGTFLFHPGSAKILDVCQKVLGLGDRDLRLSRRFLRRHGNLSSASLLFILEDALRTEKPKPGSYGLLAALGPGFSCETALLRFL